MRYQVIWEIDSWTDDENGDSQWLGCFKREPFEVEVSTLAEAISAAETEIRERTKDGHGYAQGRIHELIDENSVHYVKSEGKWLPRDQLKLEEQLIAKEPGIDEIIEKEGYRKFLAKVRHLDRRPGYPMESWVILVSKKEPQIGQRTKETIGTFCINIPEGEVIQVESYDFYQAQEHGVIPKNCIQCCRPLTPENIFGLTDLVGWGGRNCCSKSCFRLAQED